MILNILESALENFSKLNNKSLEDSLELSYWIVKDEKLHIIGETLVLPAAGKMAEIIEKTIWQQNEIQSFASKYCWKVYRKHCWRSKEPGIRINYAVWDIAVRLAESTDISNIL